MVVKNVAENNSTKRTISESAVSSLVLYLTC